MDEEIQDYYEALAPTYDEQRFGNSYGSYLHEQERAVLAAWLGEPEGRKVLSLGCGTGRLMGYATDGVDFSPTMIAVAKARQPSKRFTVADAARTPYPGGSFDAIFCLHVFMHQSRGKVAEMLAECHRLLRPGGSLIADFPSRTRRALVGYKAQTWHGAQAFSLSGWRQLAGPGWHLDKYQGLLWLPVHRLPEHWRKPLAKLDWRLCRSPLRAYASYLIVQLEKR